MGKGGLEDCLADLESEILIFEPKDAVYRTTVLLTAVRRGATLSIGAGFGISLVAQKPIHNEYPEI